VLSMLLISNAAEAGKLLPHMLLFSEEHIQEGMKLQQSILAFEDKFKEIVEEVWAEEQARTRATADTRDQDGTPSVAGEVKNIAKPPKPVFGPRSWTVRFWL
jgi:hypothetical protein